VPAHREAEPDLDALPGRVGPMNSRPNGRSVVCRMLSKSSRVPPSISRRSCHSICRQPGVSTSM